MAIIFALIAFLGWGTGDIFGGIVAKKIGGYSAAFWSYVSSLLLTSLYIPFAISQLHNLTIGTFILFIFLMPIGVIPLMTLYEGIRVGNASLVGTIGAAFGMVVVILSILFLGEKINTGQVVSIIIILAGLVLSSLDLSKIKIKQLITDKGVPYALTSMICWGIYFTFIKIPIKQIGWFWPAYLSWLSFLPLVYIFMKVRKIKLQVPKGKTITSLVGNVILLCSAIFAYNFAINSGGQSAIVAPIASAYPALFAILAYFVFKDRLNKQQIAGIIITLLGIILLSTS